MIWYQQQGAYPLEKQQGHGQGEEGEIQGKDLTVERSGTYRWSNTCFRSK